MKADADIVERLLDFDNCGNTATERYVMRAEAAAEIQNLRYEAKRLRRQVELPKPS